MVHFTVAFCSTLLASAGFAAAYPSFFTPFADSSLERRDILFPRGVDPARIEAVRNRVNRPKEPTSSSELESPSSKPESEPQSQTSGKKLAAPPQAANSQPSSKGPNQNTNPGRRQSDTKSAPKGSNASSKKSGSEDQPKPSPKKGSRPSKAGPGQSGEAPVDENAESTPQTAKLSGGTSSQTEPSTSIQRGGNSPRTGPKDSKRIKGDRKGKPKVQDGIDDLEGSERVARDAVEGAGIPRERSRPSKDIKALKKPNTSNKQGSVGKGGQVIPQPIAGAVDTARENQDEKKNEMPSEPVATAKEIESKGDFGTDGAGDERDEEGYFEWFRSNESTPARYVVKAKEGWKNQFNLKDKAATKQNRAEALENADDEN